MGSQTFWRRNYFIGGYCEPVAPVDPREADDAGFVLSMHGKPKQHFLIGKASGLPIRQGLKSARPLQVHWTVNAIPETQTP